MTTKNEDSKSILLNQATMKIAAAPTVEASTLNQTTIVYMSPQTPSKVERGNLY